MRTFGPLLAGIAILLTASNAQNASVAPHKMAITERVDKFVHSGWTEDERMLSKAISIRAVILEEKTGFRFDNNWEPKVSLEWSLGSGASGSSGTYRAETQTIYFPISVLYGLTARHTQLLGSMDADIAAGDDEFAELLDHELGHELMDQVSRRNGLGAWFTEERFNTSTEGERVGLDILSEGTALFFQRVSFPRDDRELSQGTFPATLREQRFYTYRMIAYDGGYWMVRDVLNRYGERGLIWLMSHPFVARDNMRAAAVAYRYWALKELSSK